MNKLLNTITLSTFLLLSHSLQADDDIFDESLEDLLSMETELKADIGSRNGAKNILESRSPIDVITSKQIKSSGLTSLTDILRYFIAGFNAPETSVADGSDHIRTFTLRGMAPDQILVLINGKRVHTSSLLHVNGTIGRGSSNVDLDTIIPISIQKIEILRDGAAAQYGSDAIAGVINIILKGANHKNSFSIHHGRRFENDGKNLITNSFLTFPLRYDGFFNISLQAKSQEQTNRAGIDKRLEHPYVTTHAGIPDSKNLLATLNTEIAQFDNILLYSNAIINYRDSEASAFFRPSDHNEKTTLLYPNGFLPLLNAKIIDTSLTVGINGELSNEIFWDLSNVYGYNRIKYYINNSMNYSLGALSPTSFYNGSLSFSQNTTNLDLKKDFYQLKIAGGLEYRYESYKIDAGDKSSYIDGGSQGFPGYSEESDIDKDRYSYALYLDTTYLFQEGLSLEGAIRYENYSDFGSTTNLKLASDYRVVENVLLRASLSTGFRAPSLAQSNYSNIATFGGVRSGTFQPYAPISQELGAKALKAETSKHLTVGTIYKVTNSTTITIDYFLTDVNDKIILSDPQTLTQEQQRKYKVEKISCFTNAIDTRTYGIDIKLNKKIIFQNSSSLDVTLWYNYNKNRVLKNITKENSFEQIDRVENGQPKHNIKLLSRYEINKLTYQLNLNAFSNYAQVINNERYWFEKQLITDLDISYKITNDISIAIGGNNIFDSMPNRWDGLSSKYYGYDTIKPYSRYSPFGYSGAYYYINISMEF